MFKVGDEIIYLSSDNKKIPGTIIGDMSYDTSHVYPIVVKINFPRGTETALFTTDGRIIANGGVCIVHKKTPDQEKIEELEKRIVELERLNKPNPWRSNMNEIYWYVNSQIECDMTNEAFWVTDDERYKIGNYFKTEEECQEYADKTKELFSKRV